MGINWTSGGSGNKTCGKAAAQEWDLGRRPTSLIVLDHKGKLMAVQRNPLPGRWATSFGRRLVNSTGKGLVSPLSSLEP